MDFVAKRARHAEPDEPDVLACDLDHARASKLDVVQIAFGGTLKNLQRLHAVDLVKILPEADVLALNIHATVLQTIFQDGVKPRSAETTSKIKSQMRTSYTHL